MGHNDRASDDSAGAKSGHEMSTAGAVWLGIFIGLLIAALAACVVAAVWHYRRKRSLEHFVKNELGNPYRSNPSRTITA